MADKCDIILDKEEFEAGEALTGRIECNFGTEIKIKGIRIKINGEGKVSWKASRYSYRRAEEIYLEMENDLISGEITLPQGLHVYPFTFSLPSTLPASMSEGDPTYYKDIASFLIPLAPIEVYYGAIQYTTHATIVRSWATNYELAKSFRVRTQYDLNAVEGLEKPLEINKAIRPTSVFKDSGPIAVNVQLPVTGFVPGETAAFSCMVKNGSTIDIQYVQFKFVQGYTFHANQQSKGFDVVVGEEFVVKDSSVESGNEKTWTLELTVPTLFAGNFSASNIIKIFWELRGEVFLPFPHRNFTVHVPITLGTVPLAKCL